MKVKEESEKFGLKLNTQKTKIVASGPITSLQVDGDTMGAVRLYFWGSKITAGGERSHDTKPPTGLSLDFKTQTKEGSQVCSSSGRCRC